MSPELSRRFDAITSTIEIDVHHHKVRLIIHGQRHGLSGICRPPTDFESYSLQIGLKTESDHHFIFDDERVRAPKGRTLSHVHVLPVVPVIRLTRQPWSFVPCRTLDLHRNSARSSGGRLLNRNSAR